jgi:hypothetical protein
MTNLKSSKTQISDENLAELERKRERVMNRLKQQEEKEQKEKYSNNSNDNDKENTIFGKVDSKPNLFQKLKKEKNKDLPHQRSEKIMKLAKRLEDHLHKPDNEEFNINNKYNSERDEYTQILLSKPINQKKGRKLTKINFVLNNSNN